MTAAAGGAGGPAPERDPGLQPERTRLAWRRTTLAFTVVAVLAARQTAIGGADLVGLLGFFLALLVWLAFLGVAQQRIRVLKADVRPPVMSHRGALAAAGCAVALAAAAVAVVR
ncbi:DUF202 domain-containing protein [Streptomyces sp. NPDC048057]|uniref:DUF202 domain-containing protein n=1 Tax=Streptomyces sp. NPDC048057 TaxID=3155628 RepID=UPI0033D4D125